MFCVSYAQISEFAIQVPDDPMWNGHVPLEDHRTLRTFLTATVVILFLIYWGLL